MSINLGRFLPEALRAMRNHKHEVTDDGHLYFAGAKAFIGGYFKGHYTAPGDDFASQVVSANRVVNQGLNTILNLLGGHAVSTPLYLAPFGGNVGPAAGWEADTFATDATEFTAYTPGTRLPWTTVPSTAQSLSNVAALAAATLTFNAGGPYTVRGSALLSASAKGSAAGILVAAARFSADLTGMMGGGKLGLEYGISALDEADAP